jgi:hypothetical protein
MAVLSERQKKAELLARELAQCSGVWVTSPMPLDDSARALRFQVLDTERDSVVEELCAGGWIPNQVSAFPRFTAGGLVAASMFEIAIEKERQPVPDDGPKMPGEAIDAANREAKKKMDAEIAAFRKSAGLDR